MTITLIALLGLVCGVTVYTLGCISTGLFGRHTALASCQIMFLSYQKNNQVLMGALLVKVLLGAANVAFAYFAATSKHFVISLDIVFYFSSLLLLLCYASNTGNTFLAN